MHAEQLWRLAAVKLTREKAEEIAAKYLDNLSKKQENR